MGATPKQWKGSYAYLSARDLMATSRHNIPPTLKDSLFEIRSL